MDAWSGQSDRNLIRVVDDRMEVHGKTNLERFIRQEQMLFNLKLSTYLYRKEMEGGEIGETGETEGHSFMHDITSSVDEVIMQPTRRTEGQARLRKDNYKNWNYTEKDNLLQINHKLK